jgi:hypothetical protein
MRTGSLKQIGCPLPSMGLLLGNLWLSGDAAFLDAATFLRSFRCKKTISFNSTLLAYLHLRRVHRLLPPIDRIKSKK